MTGEHKHWFLTVPGRCYVCHITSDEARRQAEHRRQTEAWLRLAEVLDVAVEVLERLERRLDQGGGTESRLRPE